MLTKLCSQPSLRASLCSSRVRRESCLVKKFLSKLASREWGLIRVELIWFSLIWLKMHLVQKSKFNLVDELVFDFSFTSSFPFSNPSTRWTKKTTWGHLFKQNKTGNKLELEMARNNFYASSRALSSGPRENKLIASKCWPLANSETSSGPIQAWYNASFFRAWFAFQNELGRTTIVWPLSLHRKPSSLNSLVRLDAELAKQVNFDQLRDSSAPQLLLLLNAWTV